MTTATRTVIATYTTQNGATVDLIDTSPNSSDPLRYTHHCNGCDTPGPLCFTPDLATDDIHEHLRHCTAKPNR